MRMSKIYTIILISLTLFSSFIHAENEAGTRIAFNEQLISKVIKWGVPQILPKLQDITIPDVSTSVQAGIITIDIRLTEIHVAVNDFKPEDLIVDFQSPDTVAITLQDVKASGHFVGTFSWAFIHDSEHVDLIVNKVSLNLGIKMLTREASGKKFPDADFSRFDIGLDFDFNLSGSAISGFINILKPVIKGALTDTILGTIKSQSSSIMKKIFADLPEYYPIQDPLSLNYAFLSNPIVDAEFLILNSYGALVNKNIPETLNPPFEIPTNLPVFDKEGKEIQIYASDYTINSILYTLYLSGLLKIDVKPEIVPEKFPIQLTTSWLRTLIWGLDKVYGKDKKCEVNFNVHSQPEIKFEEKLISVKMPTEMIVNVRKDDATLEQAIKVDTEFIFDVDFQVIEEGQVSAYIHEMKLQNTTIIETTVPTAKADTMESLINILTLILRPVLNTFVLKKLPIKLPVIQGINFSDSKVTHTSHYVAVNVNLVFQSTVHETMRVDPENIDELTFACPEGELIEKLKLKTNPHGLLYYRYTCIPMVDNVQQFQTKRVTPFDDDELFLSIFM